MVILEQIARTLHELRVHHRRRLPFLAPAVEKVAPQFEALLAAEIAKVLR